MIEANNPTLKSFITVPADHDFPIQNLPFGIFSTQANQQKRVGVAIGDYVVDLAALAEAHLLDDIKLPTSLYQQSNLNALMAEGRKTATTLRNAISKLLRHDNPALQDNVAAKDKALVPMKQATLHLPVAIGGYTDFYLKNMPAILVRCFATKIIPYCPTGCISPLAMMAVLQA